MADNGQHPLRVGALPFSCILLLTPPAFFNAQHLPAYTCTQCNATFDPLSVHNFRAPSPSSAKMKFQKLGEASRAQRSDLLWISYAHHVCNSSSHFQLNYTFFTSSPILQRNLAKLREKGSQDEQRERKYSYLSATWDLKDTFVAKIVTVQCDVGIILSAIGELDKM